MWLVVGSVGPGWGLCAQQLGIDSTLIAAQVRIVRWNEKSTRGALTGLWTADSLAIEGSTIEWGSIRQLDRQDGNHWLRGVFGGLIASAAVGVYFAVSEAGESDLSAGGLWLMGTSFSTVITVPVGALIGSAYPRWKTVYWADLPPP
jgi:hypothetical protein